MNKTTGIEKAVQKAGGAANLAEQVGVARQAVYQWIAAGVVPAGNVIAVHDATAVPVWELNPVIYPRRVVG